LATYSSVTFCNSVSSRLYSSSPIVFSCLASISFFLKSARMSRIITLTPSSFLPNNFT